MTVGSLLFGAAALVASGFSPHRLDAYGVSLLTLSVCLITPRVAGAAVLGLSNEEEEAAAQDAASLGDKTARLIARAIWWVAARDRVIVVLILTGTAAVVGAAANAAHTTDTSRTAWLLGIGFGLFAVALFFGSVSVAVGSYSERSTPPQRLAVWLGSARPAIIFGSVAFLAGTALQLIATFRH